MKNGKKGITNFAFEIINIRPVNKYISDCEVKIFYPGKNRNGSYISKAVANEIAKTIPRSPIVAFYNEEIEDYEDHGEEIVINRKGIKFVKKTVPFGSVSENEPIIWKEFLDKDGVTREYMVAKGYLWTGRYPHLQSIIDSSKGQSMEFFPESVQGDWAKFDNSDDEIFIFTEAVISALCILGDDVEPAFEGAEIYGINHDSSAYNYSLNQNEFKTEFNQFMFELNKVLKEGSEIMENEIKDETIQNIDDKTDFELEGQENSEEVLVEAVETEVVETEEEVKEEILEEMIESVEEEIVAEAEVVETEVEAEVEFSLEDYAALNEQFSTLKAEFEILTENYNKLVAEKQAVIDAEKDAVIEKFSAILGEDVNAIKEAKSDYSVEDIEDKLSAIAFKKGVSFNLEKDEEESAPVLLKFNHKSEENIPEWLKAVDKRNKQ